MSEQVPTSDAIAAARQLDWFIGTWQIASRIRTPEGWAEDTCHSTVESILDGNALLESFKGTLNGDAFAGKSLRAYNRHTGRWEQAWTDNSDQYMTYYLGTFSDGRFVGHSRRSVEDPENTPVHHRETFYDIKPRSFAWMLEVSRDAGQTWQVVWELDYTRA